MPCLGRRHGEFVSSLAKRGTPKGGDNSILQVKGETRECNETFVGLENSREMSANVVDDQSHIISKGSDASLASPRSIVELPEEDVHNQDKEKRGEWATLANPTRHPEPFKC